MVLEEWDFGKVWSCIGCPLQVAAQPIGYAAGYWPGVRASILVPENLRTTPLDTERRRWFLETRLTAAPWISEDVGESGRPFHVDRVIALQLHHKSCTVTQLC